MWANLGMIAIAVAAAVARESGREALDFFEMGRWMGIGRKKKKNV